MPKILIWESLTILAGGQKVALQVAGALANCSECIFLIPGRGPLAEELDRRRTRYFILDVGEYSVGKKRLSDILTYLLKSPEIFLGAYKVIRREKVKLIYVNAARNFIWAALLGNFLAIPVIWHIHNYFEDTKTRFLIKLFGKLKSVKWIVFVADTVRREFPSLYYKSAVIFNGIDTSEFKVIDRKRSDIRREFKIPDNRKLILTIGWIMPSKRQKILLQAIPLILRYRNDLQFVLIGGKRMGYQSYYEDLLRTVHDMKMEDYVTFAGHRTDIPEILNDSYVNVITSKEAFPFSLLEGWASGIPTIGPDFGSIPELIGDGVTGLIYEHQSPEDLSEKLLLLMNDSVRYQKIRESAFQSIEAYDVKVFNERVRALVEKVLEI